MSKVIGIDLGNKNCVVGVSNGEEIDIIENESCNRLSPSIVTYTNERRFGGDLAKQSQMEYCQSTITGLKYLIGLKYDSDERRQIEAIVTYKLVALDDGYTGVSVQYKGADIILRPEQCITFLLKDLIHMAQKKSPEASKRSLLNAVKIGKIDCLSLVNSTTAAAVSYVKAHEDKLPPKEAKPLPVMFIDMGDYSMNVVIALVKKNYVQIVSYAYDDHLGGALFTAELIPYLLARTIEKYKIDPRKNPRAWLRFQDEAEKLKKTLSINPAVPFDVPSLMNDVDVNFLVKREDFNARIQALVSRIEDPIQRALGYANLKKEDLYAIESLGGGARVVLVREKIAEILGKEPKQTLNIDECFAEGSVIMARKLAGDKIDLEVTDAAPNEINATFLVDGADQSVLLFKKFAPVPSEAKFTVPVNGHTTVKIASTVCSIGTIDLNVTNGQADVEVTVGLSQSTYLQYKDAHVVNNNDGSQHDLTVAFSFAGDLLEHQLQEYQQLEDEMTARDNIENKIDETKNQLESTIFEIENGVNRDFPDFFDPSEINKIKKDVKDIHAWFSDNEFDRFPLEEYQTRLDTLRGYLEPAREKAMKYNSIVDQMAPLKDKASELLTEVKTEPEHIDGGEKEALQRDIADFIEEVDKALATPKHEVMNFDPDEFTQRYNSLFSRKEALMKLPPKFFTQTTQKPSPKPTKIEHPDDENNGATQQGGQQEDIPTLEDLLNQFWYHPTFYRNAPERTPKQPQQRRQQTQQQQQQRVPPQPAPAQNPGVEEPIDDDYYYDKYGHIIGVKPKEQRRESPSPQQQSQPQVEEPLFEAPQQQPQPQPETVPPQSAYDEGVSQQQEQRRTPYVREARAEDSEEEEYYENPLSFLFGYPTRRPKQTRQHSQPTKKQQQQQQRQRRYSPWGPFGFYPEEDDYYDETPRRKQTQQQPQPQYQPPQQQYQPPTTVEEVGDDETVPEQPQNDYEDPYLVWQQNHRKQCDEFDRRRREQEEAERALAEKRRQLEEEERQYMQQKRAEEAELKRRYAQQQAQQQAEQQRREAAQRQRPQYDRAGPGFDFWDPFYAPSYYNQMRQAYLQQQQQQRQQQLREQQEQERRARQEQQRRLREQQQRQEQERRARQQQQRQQQQQQQTDPFWGSYGGRPSYFPFYF